MRQWLYFSAAFWLPLQEGYMGNADQEAESSESATSV